MILRAWGSLRGESSVAVVESVVVVSACACCWSLSLFFGLSFILASNVWLSEIDSWFCWRIWDDADAPNTCCWAAVTAGDGEYAYEKPGEMRWRMRAIGPTP